MQKIIQIVIVFVCFTSTATYGSQNGGKSTPQKHWLTGIQIGGKTSLDRAAYQQGQAFEGESDDPISNQYKLLNDSDDTDLEEDDTLTCFCCKLICWRKKR